MAQWNGDTSESKKAGEDKKTPMVAPADGIAGSVDAADQHKCCERDVHAHHHRENIREAAAGKGPTPVRQRPSPGIRQRFYREPYSSDGEKVLPSAGWLPFSSGSEQERNATAACDREGQREAQRH